MISWKNRSRLKFWRNVIRLYICITEMVSSLETQAWHQACWLIARILILYLVQSISNFDGITSIIILLTIRWKTNRQSNFRFEFNKMERLVLVPLLLIMSGEFSLANRCPHTLSHCVKGCPETNDLISDKDMLWQDMAKISPKKVQWYITTPVKSVEARLRECLD